MTNEAIVIGWINKGKPADCGETMKNQLMIHRLEELGVKCRCVDFKNWRRHPWVFLQLIWNLVIHKKDTIIFSTSTVNVYPMMKLMKKVKWKQPTIHWVIGGTLGEKVKNGIFDKDIIGYMDWTIVESNLMVQQLTDCGVKNVFQLPNFKPITYYPNIKERINEWKKEITRPLRFVFLSRIMKEKGCDDIIEAARRLNATGFKDKYTIDFYGKIAETYKTDFFQKLEPLQNVNYRGFLNLQNEKGYDKLSQYDLMLFPTYWKGEGFAGVFIDALISGIPMIVKCRCVDFKNWRRHPWVFLQLIWNLVIHKKDTIIFSTSTVNVYPMMKLMKKVKWKQPTIHWVIGGTLGEKVKNGIFDKDIIGYMDWTIVESNLMVQQLTDCGVKNVFQLPNFKPITYYPNIKERINEWKKEITRPLRFVFLSRIMKEKGCDDIIEAARRLNATGFKDKYTIDFYGKIAETYKTDFFQKLEPLQNVNYRGFLNLQNEKGYDKLSQYDLMLFPTYWKGEGFAGVFIDALISGIPMIVTDWAHNRQFMTEGETALFIPVHDVSALYNKMKECIEGCYDIRKMALKCQQNAETYNVDKVITKSLLKKLKLA